MEQMPPQGESTGLAIEDGVLLARILSRRATRSIDQLFADFQSVRRPEIKRHYAASMTAMRYGAGGFPWYAAVLFEWVSWMYFLWRRWNQVDHYSSDVEKMELPA